MNSRTALHTPIEIMALVRIAVIAQVRCKRFSGLPQSGAYLYKVRV